MFSLVLPTYNEAENIRTCIQSIKAVLKDYNYEIIVADDNSSDLTWKIVEELNDPKVRVIRRLSNKGLSPAVIDAFEIAKGDILGVMDADLQHDESALPEMLSLLEQNEMVIASRKCAGGSFGEFPLIRRLTSWVATVLAQVILQIDLTDPMAGYFVIRKEAYLRAKKNLNPQGFKIMLELFCAASPIKYCEIGFKFRNRLAGKSKLTSKVAFLLLKSLMRYRKMLKLSQNIKFNQNSTKIVSLLDKQKNAKGENPQYSARIENL
jgi:dolichol-phosphate mannosyltransferase